MPELDFTDVSLEVSGLKKFQQTTVAHVVSKLTSGNGSRKFLVADEVGLGKTKVARGVIQIFLRALEKNCSRPLTVLYLCANQQLAWQNLRSFNFYNDAKLQKNSPDMRLGLLPWYNKLDEEKNQDLKLRIYALTPGTSFEISSGSGTMRERALLAALLDECKSDTAFKKVMAAFSTWPSGPGIKPKLSDSWETEVKHIEGSKQHLLSLREKLKEAVQNNDVVEEFIEFYYKKNNEQPDTNDCLAAIRRCFVIYGNSDEGKRKEWRKENDYPGAPLSFMRRMMAKIGISILQPDLVIMDEFQRYDRLLFQEKQDSEAGLFSQLIKACEEQEHKPYFLLLSATPYATFAGENESADHSSEAHQGFIKLLNWLADEKGCDFESLRKKYFEAIAAGQETEIAKAKKEFESAVLQYMCRTERKNLKPVENCEDQFNRDFPESLWHSDQENLYPMAKAAAAELLNYQTAYSAAKDIGFYHWHQLLDFAKYSTKPLSFMKGYKLQHEALKRKEVLRDLFWENHAALEKCQDSRIKKLQDILGELHTKKLLWLPPSCPRRDLAGPFKGLESKGLSKVLIFSSWRFVPRMISLVLSSQLPLPEGLQEGEFDDDCPDKFAKLWEEEFDDDCPDKFAELPKRQSSHHPAQALKAALDKYFDFPQTYKDDIEKIINSYIKTFVFRVFWRNSKPINENTDVFLTPNMLKYCKDGCLEDVFDEYIYMIRNQLGETKNPWELKRFLESYNLRSPSYLEVEFSGEEKGTEKKKQYAAKYSADCFGEKDHRPKGASADENQQDQGGSMANLQQAFNSPFAPFVLSTTSIGQEGLDFHWYCRKIIHWNIPGSPIELEQRNGRIDRYHNLSIRQSLAIGKKIEKWDDIWTDADKDEQGLMPDWYVDEPEFPIEQYAYYLPLSQDEDALKLVCFQSGYYRSVMGQPSFQEFFRTCSKPELLQKYALSFLPPAYDKPEELFTIRLFI